MNKQEEIIYEATRINPLIVEDKSSIYEISRIININNISKDFFRSIVEIFEYKYSSLKSIKFSHHHAYFNNLALYLSMNEAYIRMGPIDQCLSILRYP